MKRRSTVRLEPNTIIFPRTFIRTTNRFTFTITNQTDQQIHFSVRCMSSNEGENSISSSKFDLDTSIGRQKLSEVNKFHSEFFNVEPSHGELWPNRSQYVIASFSPQDSIRYKENFYIYIPETKEKFPFSIEGFGVPPCARFNVTSINTGPVTLESILEYQVNLENTGDVPVSFHLIHKDIFGIEFHFDPESGVIPVNNSVPILITFIANQVRQFSETFTFEVSNSSTNHPTITLFGRVIGPVFSLSTNRVDFGNVSLGTINRKSFFLENKSLIPFDFNFRAGHDGSYAHKEISIIPSGGFIDKFGKQLINVEFIPTEEKVENAEIYLDISKFGDKLRIIPVTAVVIEPKIKIDEPNFNMGIVYIGHKLEHVFKLTNDSDLIANFCYEKVDDVTQISGDAEVFSSSASIPPNSTIDFSFFFTPKILGQFVINGNLRILGSSNYVHFSLSGISSGPKLVISPEKIDLGKIKVLQDVKKIVTVENKSPIAANYTIEIDSQFPVFRIIESKLKGVIQPNETEEFELITNLDDSRTFTGNIIFHVEFLQPIVIPLKAFGTGVPIVSSIEMETLDLGTLLTEHIFALPFTITNKGMRKCSVMFSLQKPKIFGCTNEEFYSAVKPSTIEIQAGDSIDFKFEVSCPRPAEFTMMFQCHATLGNHRIVMYTPKVSGNFVYPKLTLSTTSIDFKHFHDFEKEEELTGHNIDNISPSPELLPSQIQSLSVTNLVSIPVDVIAEIPQPFILSQTHFHLLPNVPVTFTITFDPLFKTDFISETILKKIVFRHGIHSIKFSVNVSAEIYFPNIDFNPSGPVDFGLMLVNTERSIDVNMKNANELDTFWDWELLPNGKNDVSNIFDIYPIRGEMKSGGSDVVHFSFVAKADEEGHGTKQSAIAVCHIKGGPDYQILLTGNSSNIDFRVEPTSIDFGNQYFLNTLTATIKLTNLSDASVSFETILPRGCQFKQITINPPNGTLPPDSSSEIEIIVVPGLPQVYKEYIKIRVARIQEVEIPILVSARFEQVELSIPRLETDAALTLYNRQVNESTNDSEDSIQPDLEKVEEELREIESKNYLQKLTEPPPVIPISLKIKKKDEPPVYEYKGYVNARYKLDMGNIVFGETPEVQFTLKNVTSFPFSGRIVNIPLENTGFKIEPDKFEDLDVSNTIEFKASFNNDNRTIDFVGDVSFEVPLLFNDDFGIMLHLIAHTEMPSLKLSQNLIDFGSVIIGQFFTMTLQLQNMNPIQIEYEFGQPKSVSEKEPTKSIKGVFSPVPSKGTLPSQSFQNIEISFAPVEELQYLLDIPISIPQNKFPIIFHVKGIGMKIDLTFDPPILKMPSILPFDEPSKFEVTLTNNSCYPIEVYSYQFDFLNYVNERLKTLGLPSYNPHPSSLSSSHTDTVSNVSKFALCVIVHGIQLSGKSTVSKMISEHLNNCPILTLKDIWKDLLEQQKLFKEQQKELQLQQPQQQSNQQQSSQQNNQQQIKNTKQDQNQNEKSKSKEKANEKDDTKESSNKEKHKSKEKTNEKDENKESSNKERHKSKEKPNENEENKESSNKEKHKSKEKTNENEENKESSNKEKHKSKEKQKENEENKEISSSKDEEEESESDKLLTDPTDADFVEAFQDAISDPSCTNGFVLDGLDVFPEPEETEVFLGQCLKHKSSSEEVAKNPFAVFQHQTPTAWEKALSYVLAAFDGHYVFLVAIKCSEEECRDRIVKYENEVKRKKKEKSQKKKDDLIRMTEAQYDLLDEKAQEEADKKRKATRDRIIKAAQQAIEEENAKKASKKSRASLTRKRASLKITTPKKEVSDEKNDKNDKIIDEKKLASLEKKRLQQKSKLGVPLDPVSFASIAFNFTLGAIVERLLHGGDSFQVVDPNLLLRDSFILNSNPLLSTSPREISSGNKENNSKEGNNKDSGSKDGNNKDGSNKDGNNKDNNNTDESTFIQKMNSLLINGCDPLQNLSNHIESFLPSLEQMKEKSFTRLIPKPRRGIIDYILPKKAQIEKKPNAFTIISEDIMTDLLQQEQQSSSRSHSHHSPSSSMKKSGTTGRSSRRQKARNDPMGLNQMIPFIDELDLTKFTPRWNIDPNSSKKIVVEFHSLKVGKYVDYLNFGISDCKFDIYKLKVIGNCLYPEINREITTFFSSVVNRFTPKVKYSWVKKLEAFHCGYLLLTGSREKSSSSSSRQQQQQQQQNQYKFPITLKNESEFNADIICTFDEPTKVWTVDTPNLAIKPSEEAQINVSIHPNIADIMKTRLLILIKDNPNPVILPLIAEGTLPLIEMNPSTVDFERCLLKQSKSIDVVFTNNGKIPCEWAVKHNTHLGPNITLSENEGTILPKNSSTLTVTFQSAKPLQYKKSFQIDVFDKDKTKSFSSQTINVIAEAYDTHFDVVYPKGMTHLQFGNVKVGQSKSIPIVLKNRSKYPVHYSISTQGNQASKMLRIDQPEGNVSPGEKTMTVNITFEHRRVTKIENKKMMTLRVTDSLTNDVTNLIPLCVSVETVISKFVVEPTKIDFGAVPVQTQNQRTFKIENKGAFPFNFDISQRIDPNEDANYADGKKKGRGRGGRGRASGSSSSQHRSQSVNSRVKGNKKLGPAIDIGGFIVQPCLGVVQPNQTVNINVDFKSTNMSENYETHAVAKITDSPEDRTIDLEFLASSFVPGLLTNDYEQIFRGQHLCLRNDVVRKNMNAFLEDEHVFHFAPLILHDSSSVPIYLKNPFPIPCTIDLSVKPRNKSGMANFPFDVSEKTVNVPAKEETSVELKFQPLSCENFIGFFEANVKGGTSPDSKTLKFCVEGTGALPILTLLTKLDKAKNGVYNVPLGRVLINSSREKTVAIRNDAFIPANVRVSIKQNSTEYTLKDADYYAEPLLLETGRILNITVKFSPQMSHRASFEVCVSCPDNPKCDLILNFVGEGFIDDVVFDGSIEDDNDVLFKDNVVGRQQQCTFRMRNICNSDVRFTWANNRDFHFSPRVGHLKSGQSKMITITLFTEKSVKYNLFKVPCQWSKIELEDPRAPDWDDSMHTIEYMPRCEAQQEQQISIDNLQNSLSTSQSISGSQANFNSTQREIGGNKSTTSSTNSNASNSGNKTPNSKQGQKVSNLRLISSQKSIDNSSKANFTTPRSSRNKNLKNSSKNLLQETNIENIDADEKEEDRTLVKVVKILPEPAFKVVPAKLKDLVLRIYAVSDVIKYSIDTTNIPFAPTMMYERRVYDVKVTNTSQIKFEYQWVLEEMTALRGTTNRAPFSVTPESGVLNAGQSTVFKVHFAPEEVDDFTATFKMQIPFLSVMEPPRVSMSGLSRRPLCHFNVEMSDYLSAGRRHPAYSDPLPEGVKVIELFSKGVGKKIIKKFEIINPTSAPYEVNWTRVNKGTAQSVQCLVPQALVSSGKRYSVGFSYLPTSVKTIESLWLFTIKEHDINIYFLIVGRIVPQ